MLSRKARFQKRGRRVGEHRRNWGGGYEGDKMSVSEKKTAHFCYVTLKHFIMKNV